MIDVSHKKCNTENCEKNPSYNFVGNRLYIVILINKME